MALLDDPLDPLAPPDPTVPPVVTPPTPPAPPTGLGSWIGSQPRVNDSMAAQVSALTAEDSKLNQMARTEGLKAANRRGLLNSSMAVGASQDAVLKNVMPIAAQDASQLFNQNQAARAFEYGMTGQESQQGFESAEARALREWQTSEAMAGRNWQTGERLGSEQFQGTQAEAQRGWQAAENLSQRGFLGTQQELDRDLQRSLQAGQITEAQRAQLAQISATQGIETANRELSRYLQEQDIQFRMSEGNLTREAATAAQVRDIDFQRNESLLQKGWATAERLSTQGFQGTQAELDRDLQRMLQNNQISESQRAQLTQLAFTGGIEAANRALQQTLQENDIQFRMREGDLTRDAAVDAQNRDIAFQTSESLKQRNFQGDQATLDRDLQKMLQGNQITEAQRAQLAQIGSTEGIEQANRELQATLQDNDITFRMSEGNLTRLAAEIAQTRDQAFQRGENVDARGWQTAENLLARNFQGTQAQADRDIQLTLQNGQITSAEAQQARQIAATGDIEAANRFLQEKLQANDITFRMTEGNLTRAQALEMQHNDQVFQRGENVATRTWQTAENLEARHFQGDQADLDRDLQTLLQQKQIDSTEVQQFRQIASTEGIEAANRQLQASLQEKDIDFRMREGDLTREAAVAAQNLDIMFQKTEGALDRDQQSKMQEYDIAFRMKEGNLDRAAAVAAQKADIAYRMTSGNLDRASAERMQAAEIKANTQIAALDRGTQEKIASWNLSATNKSNVADMITEAERTYAANYATIMNNTTMSAPARTTALAAAKAQRSRDLSLVEQTYGVNLTW